MKPANQAFEMMQKAVGFHQSGQMPEAEQSYRKVLATFPQNYDALRLLGGLYLQWDKAESAIDCFQKALVCNPGNPEVRNNLVGALNSFMRLGNNARKTGNTEEACRIYEKLAVLVPNEVTIHLNLGTIYRDLGKTSHALGQYEVVLKLQPASVDAAINRASLLMEMDRPAEALAGYEVALKLDPQNMNAIWGKSLALLMMGKFEEGWKLYESRFARMPQALLFKDKPWNGEDLKDKRLLIWGEQGFGDVLQFIRYAMLCKVKDAEVIVLCREPLIRLLQNCPYIDKVVTKASSADFDYQIPVMSLPAAFGTTLETVPQQIPYLFVNDEVRQKWAPRFAGIDGCKVGLVWAGNPRKNVIEAHITDRQRSMGLGMFQPLLDMEGFKFYSLQKGEVPDTIDQRLTDYTADINDFMDTAAITENLDLVITVDTSVAHLAGALGKPVWILSRFGGCWRWLGNRERTPWYPSARIFGQPSAGEWGVVIEKVRENLRKI